MNRAERRSAARKIVTGKAQSKLHGTRAEKRRILTLARRMAAAELKPHAPAEEQPVGDGTTRTPAGLYVARGAQVAN